MSKPAAALLLVAAIAAIATLAFRHRQESPAMKPSVTYLHLLRHTPFFTELTTDQLRWVIQHSREWEVDSGQTIVSSDSADDAAGYWVLLDGGWQVELRGQPHASGHADPGKWFNRDQLGTETFKLAANDHSYVMHITKQDMDEMLASGFQFDRHIEAGKTFYRELTH
jgi:hypothetical protein